MTWELDVSFSFFSFFFIIYLFLFIDYLFSFLVLFYFLAVMPRKRSFPLPWSFFVGLWWGVFLFSFFFFKKKEVTHAVAHLTRWSYGGSFMNIFFFEMKGLDWCGWGRKRWCRSGDGGGCGGGRKVENGPAVEE